MCKFRQWMKVVLENLMISQAITWTAAENKQELLKMVGTFLKQEMTRLIMQKKKKENENYSS